MAHLIGTVEAMYQIWKNMNHCQASVNGVTSSIQNEGTYFAPLLVVVRIDVITVSADAIKGR